MEAVAERGAEAALDFGETFDGVRPAAVRVPDTALDAALAGLDRDVRDALQVMIERTRAVHADQRRTDSTTTLDPGATVTERWVPVERVGLYVPGGNAVYPSSVVMNVVPAQAAGVDSLVVASPPQAELRRAAAPDDPGRGPPVGSRRGLGGRRRAGGGAAGLRRHRHDGAELAPVDMITGPGNIYVTAAKRLCRSVVGIDAEAGPTEIAILADDTADPVHVAADLISQAEHDEMAASVLVTPSVDLADATDAEVAAQLQTTVHRERVTAALSGRAIGDHPGRRPRCGPQRRERLRRRAPGDPDRRRAAGCRPGSVRPGAIFVGAWAPVSLGDYCAGSNHVLPTAGCARHSSGLSVQTFLRGIHVVDYTEAALKDVPDTSSRWPRPRTCRRTARRYGGGSSR